MSIRRSRRRVSRGAAATAAILSTVEVTTVGRARTNVEPHVGHGRGGDPCHHPVHDEEPDAGPEGPDEHALRRLEGQDPAHRQPEREQRRVLAEPLVGVDRRGVVGNQEGENKDEPLIARNTAVNSSRLSFMTRLAVATGWTDATRPRENSSRSTSSVGPGPGSTNTSFTSPTAPNEAASERSR